MRNSTWEFNENFNQKLCDYEQVVNLILKSQFPKQHTNFVNTDVSTVIMRYDIWQCYFYWCPALKNAFSLFVVQVVVMLNNLKEQTKIFHFALIC